MRANEFIKEEEKLDEVLPLITGAASLVGGSMKLAGGVASGIGAAAKGVGKGIGAAAKGVGKAVGAVGNKVADKLDPQDKLAQDRAKDQLLQPGRNIILPTKGPGGPEKFKVTKVQGDEVEIENPEGNKSPDQPNKLVYKKNDIKQSINI